MKVLYTFGGIPHYLDALLQKTQQRGTDIAVVIPQKGNATIGAGVKMVEGNHYRRIPAVEKKARYGKAFFPALPAIVREEKPDILVLGWPYFLQIFFQRDLRRALCETNCRLMIREIPFQTPPANGIRSYFRENPMTDEAENLLSKGISFYIRQYLTAGIRKYCYGKADGTLNYATTAYDILPSYGVPLEKIHVTGNATDTEALLNERQQVRNGKPLLPPCERRILHIGRLVKWKRVDLLIDAFPAVLQKWSDAELVIVGDGPELENLRRQASARGVNEQVRFEGSVYEPARLGGYMNESSLYVLAGMGGLSINDAMTYGLPVLCSVCDGTEKDLVRDGVNGAFFRKGDREDLESQIIRLLDSPSQLKEMGKASEKIIAEEMNLDKVCDRFIAAFRETVGEKERVTNASPL